MIKCDVHILKHPVYRREEYIAECFESLKNEPIDIHYIPGYVRHLGKGRYDGYNLGTNKYVSFVDDDDYIVPGVFQRCIDELEQNPHLDAVTTNEYIVQLDGSIKEAVRKDDRSYYEKYEINRIHHVVVCRRESIKPYLHVLLECPDLADQAIWACMFEDNRVFFNIEGFGYYWRLSDNNSRTLRIKPNNKYTDLIRKLFLSRNNLTN